MGAISQFRIMGGAVGLAIATNVLNSYVKSNLPGGITPEQGNSILRSIEAIGVLSPAAQVTVRAMFGHGYNLQMKVMIGFGVAQIPVSLMIWGKHVDLSE